MNPLPRTLSAVLIGVVASAALLVAPSMAAAPTAHALASSHSLTVKKGHTIRITLDTASDGGYGWVITQGRHSADFVVVSKKVVAAPHTGPTPVVGGNSRTIYTLRMTHVGYATFKAVERRSFDKTDVIDRYTLHLHIIKP